MLVVKQEIEPPVVTPWVVFHMAGFMFVFCLAVITMQMASVAVSKADEIMAVSALLLFVLIKCRPRYFLPYMLVQLFGDDREGINQEGYEDEQ